MTTDWTSAKDGAVIAGEASDGSAWIEFVVDCWLRDVTGGERAFLRALCHAETDLVTGAINVHVEEVCFDDERNPKTYKVGRDPFLAALADRLVDDQMSGTAHAGLTRLLETNARNTAPGWSGTPWDGTTKPNIDLTGSNVLEART